MANWYVSSVDYTAVAQFAINTAYTVGQIVRQLATPAVGSERCFRCTTAGTSGATEAAWTLTKGSTTTQGTAIFTEITGNETYQAPGAWAAPFARIAAAIAWMTFSTADQLYVAANHAESQSGAAVALNVTTNNNYGCACICVDNSASGHVPPTSGDYRTTATATYGTTSAAAVTVSSGDFLWAGISFSAWSWTLASSAFPAIHRYRDCNITLASTSSTFIQLNSGTVDFENVNVYTIASFTGGNSIFGISTNASFRWRGGSLPNAVTTAGAGVLLQTGAANRVVLEGVDLSNIALPMQLVQVASTIAGGSEFWFIGCRLSSSFVLPPTNVNTAPSYAGAAFGETNFINCDNGAKEYSNAKLGFSGSLVTDTTVTRTGGTVDGTTSISHYIRLIASNVTFNTPFFGFPIAQWNATVGSALTVTLYAIVNQAAAVTQRDLWMDVEYYGSSAAPLLSYAKSGGTPLVTTALATDTSAWDTSAAARQNSHVYAVNDVIKVASNPGRVFICTASTGANTASTEPAGFASAVDGGAVTDGGATWRAGRRVKLTVTVTPQLAGLIKATPRFASAAVANTLYLDPTLYIA